jgi:hypothetical protein
VPDVTSDLDRSVVQRKAAKPTKALLKSQKTESQPPTKHAPRGGHSMTAAMPAKIFESAPAASRRIAARSIGGRLAIDNSSEAKSITTYNAA